MKTQEIRKYYSILLEFIQAFCCLQLVENTSAIKAINAIEFRTAIRFRYNVSPIGGLL